MGPLLGEDEPRGLGALRAMKKEDVLAGLTVGVMAIPQSMAYAMLADLPPIYGLYTALVPPMAYAFVGGSKQLHVGPVSMVSLLTATAVKGIGTVDPATKAAAATLIAAIAGATQVLLGVMRMGTLVSFATQPIISGFTSGASVVVIIAQSQHIFGVSALSGVTTLHTFANTCKAVLENGPHPHSLAFGVTFIASLFFMKNMSVRYPKYPVLKAVGPLFVVVFGVAATFLGRFDRDGVKIIGSVPSGLPAPTSWGTVFRSVPSVLSVADTGLAVAFISFMESIAVAKTLAAHHGYEVDASQELVAVGLSNLAGTLFRGYSAAGAFSRSAVASGTGARSQAAAMVASVVVGVTLLFLTPLFFYLPKGVLSAIVIHAVYGLIKFSDLVRLKEMSTRDMLLWMLAFTGTLYAVTVGLLFSVAVSILFSIKDTKNPVIKRLGTVQVGGMTSFAPIGSCTDMKDDPGTLLISVSGLLQGAGIAEIKARFSEICSSFEAPSTGDYVAVIDMTHVVSLDTTALEALLDAVNSLKKSKPSPRVVAFSGLSPEHANMIKAADLADHTPDPEDPEAAHTVRPTQRYPTIAAALAKMTAGGTGAAHRSKSVGGWM